MNPSTPFPSDARNTRGAAAYQSGVSTGVGIVHPSVVILALPLAWGTLAAQSPSLTARIDAYLQRFADAGYLSGAVLVGRGDTVLYQHAWGLANRELHVPFSLDTRSNVASVTKPMTIVVAARLAEEGKLRRDQTLADWIPDFPRGDEITIDQLLNHRSGIPHLITTAAEETVPHTAADLVEFAKRADLMFEPGSTSVYSSVAGETPAARTAPSATAVDVSTSFSQQDFGSVTAVFAADGSVERFDWGFIGGTVPMRRTGPRRAGKD